MQLSITCPIYSIPANHVDKSMASMLLALRANHASLPAGPLTGHFAYYVLVILLPMSIIWISYMGQYKWSLQLGHRVRGLARICWYTICTHMSSMVDTLLA